MVLQILHATLYNPVPIKFGEQKSNFLIKTRAKKESYQPIPGFWSINILFVADTVMKGSSPSNDWTKNGFVTFTISLLYRVNRFINDRRHDDISPPRGQRMLPHLKNCSATARGT